MRDMPLKEVNIMIIFSMVFINCAHTLSHCGLVNCVSVDFRLAFIQ